MVSSRFRKRKRILRVLGAMFRALKAVLRALWWIVAKSYLLPWRALIRLPGRISRSFPEFPEELHRPAIFSLWFWFALAASYVIWALDLLGTDPDNALFGVGQGLDLIPGTLAVGILAVVWLLLPWDPRASLQRKLAAPAFLVGAFVVGQFFGGIYWSLAFYPIAFANGVFLFGFRRGIHYAAAVLVVIFTHTLLSGRFDYPEYAAGSSGWAVGNALGMAAAFVPVAVLIIGFCAPIVESNRRREETESLLGKLELAHAELQEYASHARELAVSEERSRMAREMHDSVGHYLTVVNVQLEAATKLMDERPRRAREEVVKAKGLASEALSEVRRSVRALGPRDVGRRSVADALYTLAHNSEGSGPSVSFRVHGDERSLTADAELTLYRALQESLTNALRHSGAGEVSATLTFEPEVVRLTVADDGSGAETSGTEADPAIGGFGLQTLRARVEALDGTMSVRNGEDGGFVVQVELPGRES